MARSALVMVCVAVAPLAMAGMASAAGCASGCPTIKPLSPAANSSTFDATPEIAATVKDRQTNLAKKHSKLFVDGARTTTFSYDRAADRLSHTPAAALGEGGHTVKIVARDNAGKVGRKAWRFSVGTPPDTTAPTIDTVSPTNEATGVAPQTDVAVTFSEAMDPSTLSTSTFTLVKQDSSAPVMATVSYDPATKEVTLDPAAALASTTTYTAVIKGGSGGAKDLAGNALAQDHSWTFMVCSGGIILSSPDTIVPRGVVVCG